MQIIDKYFPNLSQRQKEQFNNLDTLYREWNAKINVISRKDIDNLYERHANARFGKDCEQEYFTKAA